MNLKVLAKELSKELGEDPELIEKVGKAEFKLVRETIQSGKLDSVYLKFIGRWGIKPQRLEHFPKSVQEEYDKR